MAADTAATAPIQPGITAGALVAPELVGGVAQQQVRDGLQKSLGVLGLGAALPHGGVQKVQTVHRPAAGLWQRRGLGAGQGEDVGHGFRRTVAAPRVPVESLFP